METVKYINVAIITTFVVEMKTLFKDAYWNILHAFYNNKNSPLHLRELSRLIKLNESPLTRHLNKLVKDKVLIFLKEGNMKKFCINKIFIKNIFPAYDNAKFESMLLLRKNAVKSYIEKLQNRPVFIIVFGSTAKGTFREDSDLDIIAVFNDKVDTKKARSYAEAQTGITINEFQICYYEFIKELKLKEDNVIQAGIETGFPVYNNVEYYEVLYE